MKAIEAKAILTEVARETAAELRQLWAGELSKEQLDRIEAKLVELWESRVDRLLQRGFEPLKQGH